MAAKVTLLTALVCIAVIGCSRSESPGESVRDVREARQDAAKEIQEAQVEGAYGIAVAKAEGTHKIEMEKCESMSGDLRRVCKDIADSALKEQKEQAKAQLSATPH